MIQWTGNGRPIQEWASQSTGDGCHTIVCVGSGKVSDVSGGSRADGAALIQCTDRGGTRQLWTFSRVAGRLAAG
ncbi:RICIN domain-containing protein [Streptomyces sp. NBC_00028]|uniref:RICIN domain-containing protein n=1 Tax=Streptomyces sp. NBC_00028 TaxID=2975624 RepID=UPI00324EC912